MFPSVFRDIVVKISNRKLNVLYGGPTLTLPPATPPPGSRYRTQTCSAAPLRLATFHQLLDVMQFFDHYHSKNIDKALAVSLWPRPLGVVLCDGSSVAQVMSALGLLPLQAGETVEQKVAAFRSCQEEVELPSHPHTLTPPPPPPRSTTPSPTSCWPQ